MTTDCPAPTGPAPGPDQIHEGQEAVNEYMRKQNVSRPSLIRFYLPALLPNGEVAAVLERILARFPS